MSSLRKVIDENRYPGGLSRTRWVKYVPLKVNVTAWKIKLDALPTRLDISRRGIDVVSTLILCHVLFVMVGSNPLITCFFNVVW